MTKMIRWRGMATSSIFIVAGFLLMGNPWKSIGVYLMAYAAVIQWHMADESRMEDQPK